MNFLYSVILIGCLHFEGRYGSFQYFHTQPYAPPIQPYYQVYNPLPQFYIEESNYFATQDSSEITERPVEIPDVKSVDQTRIIKNENEKYLGFGYRTEHDNGHSNVIFISSPGSNQLGYPFTDESKDFANNLMEAAKNFASNAVDSNAQIEFPKSNELDDSVLSFFQKPVTSFHAFYTINDKVIAKDNDQLLQSSNPNLINNRIFELFSRFGFDTQKASDERNRTQTNETTENSESRSAKALPINRITVNMTTDGQQRIEATTQIITPSISTAESATVALVTSEESNTNIPENTTDESTTTEEITTTNDKIESLA